MLSVWPDLAKFHHFCRISFRKSLAKNWEDIWYLAKLSPTLTIELCHMGLIFNILIIQILNKTFLNLVKLDVMDVERLTRQKPKFLMIFWKTWNQIEPVLSPYPSSNVNFWRCQNVQSNKNKSDRKVQIAINVLCSKDPLLPTYQPTFIQGLILQRFYSVNFMLCNFSRILIGWTYLGSNQNAWKIL